jgi:glyoxylase-like metal-dependent hydrolase (beta-lactamase superfamily II)
MLLAGLMLVSGQAAAADCGQPGWYVSSPWGFRTNSFWVAGAEGSILVDTQFLPSATREVAQRVRECTGKPVLAALVLHANPDKFNGTQWLTAQGVEVLSSRAVVEAIPAVDRLRRGWFEQRYQPDYPDKLVLPKSFGDVSTRLERGGVALNLHVLGASVSAAHVVADWNGHLFVGDLVANRHHAWLELGNLDAWIGTLQFLQGLRPTRIYPGRGEPGGPELLVGQIEYLRFVQDAVRAHKPSGEIPEAVAEKISDAIKARYPGYGNEYFLELGIPAVWEKLAAVRQQ